MKTTLIATIVLTSAFMAIGQTVKGPLRKPAFSEQEKNARRLEMQRKFIERTGGLIRNEKTGKGLILFVNAQNKVPRVEMMPPAEGLSRILRIDVKVSDTSEMIRVESADKYLKECKANAAIFIVNDEKLPMSLIAPESRWAFVNIAKLSSDKPIDLLLFQRVRREMWRTFAQLLGAANSSYPECVMRPCFKASDLDALKGETLSPDPKFKIEEHLSRIGIEQFSVTPYINAVRAGWAPAPTNDIQKAIWDKVHAVPKKPMKIEFDPKKGR